MFETLLEKAAVHLRRVFCKNLLSSLTALSVCGGVDLSYLSNTSRTVTLFFNFSLLHCLYIL